MKVSAKPWIDPVTGCAHIKNWKSPVYGWLRCCSYCDAEQPKDIDEEFLTYCYNCGETFDHTDDDPKGDGENDGRSDEN